MARLSTTRNDIPLNEQEQTCIQCGEIAKDGGYWHGARCVSLCRVCAFDPRVLGALLADALFDRPLQRVDDYAYAEHALERLELAFWKAWSCAEIVSRTKDRR